LLIKSCFWSNCPWFWNIKHWFSWSKFRLNTQLRKRNSFYFRVGELFWSVWFKNNWVWSFYYFAGCWEKFWRLDRILIILSDRRSGEVDTRVQFLFSNRCLVIVILNLERLQEIARSSHDWFHIFNFDLLEKIIKEKFISLHLHISWRFLLNCIRILYDRFSLIFIFFWNRTWGSTTSFRLYTTALISSSVKFLYNLNVRVICLIILREFT